MWVSDPTWDNHKAIFEGAGFQVNTYPYYDPATRGLKFDAMLAAIEALPAQSIVLLHACCHNPTGVDLNPGAVDPADRGDPGPQAAAVSGHCLPGLWRWHRRRCVCAARAGGRGRELLRGQLLLQELLAVRRARGRPERRLPDKDAERSW